MHHALYSFFLRFPQLLRIFFIAATIILLFGGIIHFVEPKTFPTFFDGIWWAIITVSTTGYGDLVPHSTLGRVVGIILIFLGAGFISSYFFSLASTAISKQNQFSEGKLAFHGKDHLIVIGWNDRTRHIVETLFDRENENCIVLIDESLSENPMSSKINHFIRGRASLDEVLLKANIHLAKNILITADQHKDEIQADMSSILTLLSVKGLCPNLPCIIEILTTDQIKNAIRAGADTIIETNQIVSKEIIEKLHHFKAPGV
ncbi:ion channel [Neobacillus sp. D3-1R]|uniref:ion channel n=1 Tax=Neobacillus sp. D3-1R TaxID=3445778 RepID=UPI003F9F724E